MKDQDIVKEQLLASCLIAASSGAIVAADSQLRGATAVRTAQGRYTLTLDPNVVGEQSPSADAKPFRTQAFIVKGGATTAICCFIVYNGSGTIEVDAVDAAGAAQDADVEVKVFQVLDV